MSIPALIVFDTDDATRAAVASQLTQRYGRDYRVVEAPTLEAGAGALHQLAADGDDVAIVLASAALLDSTAGELLEHASRLHPHAKRGLIVPGALWTDRTTAQATLDAMALGRADYYVSPPVGSPDEVFHEAISNSLLDWSREARRVPQTIQIVSDEWSGRAYELRTVFERCAVPHAFCLADSAKGRELLANADPGTKLPMMLLPDGRVLSDPSNGELAAAAGAPTDVEDRVYDLVIVGAGPAGLSAAVYAASEGLQTLVIDEGGIGGQARSSSLIRNYLGFPRGVSGSRLAEQAYEQAAVFGANFVFMHRAASLAQYGERLAITLADGRRIDARTALLATGASYRRLDVPSLEALTGAGVFYGGPASEAHALIGKDVYIAGGGNSAGQAALHLARYARQVTLVVRGASLETGMSYYLTRELEVTPNIEMRLATTVVGGGGDGRLQELVLREGAMGDEEHVTADALFVLIGAWPHTAWLPTEIARDDHGFVFTGEDLPDDAWLLERRPVALETSLPGVLAVGDARHGSVKRVASAVGEGSVAVQLVHGLLAPEPVAARA